MGDNELKRTFKLEATVDVEFDADDVKRNLTPLQSVDLIVEIDDEVGEWEHTLLLYHHFAEQFKLAKEHAPDLASMTPEQLREEMKKNEETTGE